MRTVTWVLFWLLPLAAFASNRPEYVVIDGPFNLSIQKADSTGELKVGFGKGMAAFLVKAANPHRQFTLYCVRSAPEVGHTYSADEGFATKEFSYFHEWPVARSAVLSKDFPRKGPQLYRVVTIHNVFPGTQSDIVCDVHTESPIP